MWRVRPRRWVPMLQDRRIIWHSGPYDLICTRVSELSCSSCIPLHKELIGQSRISTNRVDSISSIYLEMHGEQGVIDKILSNFGERNDRLNAKFLKLAWVTDPTEHQELWRIDRSSRKYNLFLCAQSVGISYKEHADQ